MVTISYCRTRYFEGVLIQQCKELLPTLESVVCQLTEGALLHKTDVVELVDVLLSAIIQPSHDVEGLTQQQGIIKLGELHKNKVDVGWWGLCFFSHCHSSNCLSLLFSHLWSLSVLLDS